MLWRKSSLDAKERDKRAAKVLWYILTDIHQIAAGLFANLLRFRVSGNPAPLARAVRWGWNEPAACRALKITEFSVIEAHLSREFGSDA